MKKNILLLDTYPEHSGVDVQPCILPFIVLFSIAAQENRIAGNRLRYPRQGIQAVPRMRPFYGAGNRRMGLYGTGVPPVRNLPMGRNPYMPMY